jgi:hypothetical protein
VVLSFQPTLLFGQEMADWCDENEWVEVDGDRKCLIMWHRHADGTRSVTDLYFWE